MVINSFTKKIVIAVFLVLAASSPSNAAEPNEHRIEFQMLTVSQGFDVNRANTLGKALNFQTWPQTDVFRVAPSIDKSLLQHPDLVTREGKSYSIVQFGQDSWGRCEWWADYLTEVDAASLPKELPADRIKTLMEHLDPEQRNDPNFVEKYLQGKLERYRKSLRYRIEGSISVEIVVAPDSRGAHEYLLSRMIQNTMPTDLLVRVASLTERLPDLGTINLGASEFIRDNVVVRILKTEGKFSGEALPLAQKIDSLIKNQPALTYQQLLARKPSVTIAPYVDKVKTDGQRTVSYDISVPAGQEIISVRAFTDGELIAVENGSISLAGKKGKVKVKLTAITRELLADTFEMELIVDE